VLLTHQIATQYLIFHMLNQLSNSLYTRVHEIFIDNDVQYQFLLCIHTGFVAHALSFDMNFKKSIGNI